MRAAIVVLAILCCAAGDMSEIANGAERPNVVVILADDLGYGDLGCYNPATKVPSPNVDRLAKQGMRFTDAHSGSAVCTPTRYGLLTGRYAWRTRLQRGVFYAYDEPLIASDRLTVGSLFQQHGYQTACIGKWHLGWNWPQQNAADVPDFSKPIAGGPTTRGFHQYFGTHVPNQAPYVFIENDRTVGLPTARKETRDLSGAAGPMLPGWKFEEILPTITQRAVRFLDDRAADAKPFFLYFALTTPHEPITPSPRFQGKSGINPLADLMMETDWAVGEVLNALDRNNQTKNTLVIFTADNGHATYTGLQPLLDAGHQPSGVLRGYKGEIYEGGHRVPFVARWPGVVSAESRCDELICHTNLLATCSEILGAKVDSRFGEDSASILPLLRSVKTTKPVYEAVVHHSVAGQFAIRQGDWKLIFPKPVAAGKGRVGAADIDDEKKRAERSKLELYNLASDLSESREVSGQHPEVVERLVRLMERFVTEGRSVLGAACANDVAVDIWKGTK